MAEPVLVNNQNYDFCGWATKNDLKCLDGLTIKKDAFMHNSGKIVPLVWEHSRKSPLDVLGHALLENRPGGVFMYGLFNETEDGQASKELIKHGDINSLSIFASQIKKTGKDVHYGDINEVSLVIAGANPGAKVEYALEHSSESGECAEIFTGENLFISDPFFQHSSIEESVPEPALVIETQEIPVTEVEKSTNDISHSADKTLGDVYETLTPEQKEAVNILIANAIESEDPEGGQSTMKQNFFDKDTDEGTLKHSVTEIMAAITLAKAAGTMKASFIAHGITDIEYLFPDAKTIGTGPDFIQRDMTWVQKVMGGVHHTPFSRIKSIHADITHDEARAKGYLKGNLKTEEVFMLLKRTTTPYTVYKKQKMDRDDIVDITDYDVVSWLKSEMRLMLDEELARAFLIGDGRSGASDDKINESNIRPIWTDADLYTIKHEVTLPTGTSEATRAEMFIEAAVRSRKKYKGSGSPSMFIDEDLLTECLLLKDTTKRFIYDSIDKLAQVMRVSEIIAVPVMEDQTRIVGAKTLTLGAIIVNLRDYNVGADKGGAINMFEDFDIDYNAEKYLIETRCSGALTKPFSAIAIEFTPAVAG